MILNACKEEDMEAFIGIFLIFTIINGGIWYSKNSDLRKDIAVKEEIEYSRAAQAREKKELDSHRVKVNEEIEKERLELKNEIDDFHKMVEEKNDLATKTNRDIAVDSLYEIRKMNDNFKDVQKQIDSTLQNIDDTSTACTSLIEEEIKSLEDKLSKLLDNFEYSIKSSMLTKDDVYAATCRAINDNVNDPLSSSEIESAVEYALSNYFRSYTFESDFSSVVSDIKQHIDNAESNITSMMH